uniref:Uncharacterized protein n=1 Tax=viral metagenome TaxID=1070528 RepID=A0A6C0KNI4_9ZZZZ
MPNYTCECCCFSTHIKTHYTKHLQTKKHQKYKKSQPKVNLKSTFSQPLVNIYKNSETITPYRCHYCMKYFKFKQSMYKHIKYSCKKNNDEDLRELARLLNEKDKQMEDKESQLEKMQRQIDKLTNKLQIQNINNGTIHNNIVNIQLLNYTETDYSHLTPNDYMTCIKDCNTCVKSLIEKVHFNENKPENRNIYLSNIKGKYVMIYKDNVWQIIDKKEQIDDIYNYNELVLESWYDDYKDKYPDIINSFQRYLKNKDENVVLNKVKDEILLMLYNKRQMISLE